MNNQRRSILNVGKQLNLKNPEKNWLAADHLKEKDQPTYHFVELLNGKYIICSSFSKDETTTDIEFFADQTGRRIETGCILFSFKPSQCGLQVGEVMKIAGKTNFSFYVYK